MALRLNGSTSGYTEINAPAVAGSNTLVLPTGNGTNGQFLQTNGSGTLSWAAAGSFAAGTAMLFVQTAAPTGWTKSTTHDNKALRVVSGAASSGGTAAFTTVFASRTPAGTVGSTTLTTSQIPSHAHQATRNSGTPGTTSADGFFDTFRSTTVNWKPFTLGALANQNYNNGTDNTGGGGSHDHSFTGTAMDFAVQYVDVIIATKD